jgi:chromosome segregation ATPase
MMKMVGGFLFSHYIFVRYKANQVLLQSLRKNTNEIDYFLLGAASMEMEEIATLMRTIVSEEIKPIKDKLGELKQEVCKLNEAVGELKKRLKNRESQYEKQENRSKSILEQPDDIKQTVETINVKLDTLQATLRKTYQSDFK